jgi:hypothetical protein
MANFALDRRRHRQRHGSSASQIEVAHALLQHGARQRNHPRRRDTNDHDARAARKALSAFRAQHKAEERRKGFA